MASGLPIGSRASLSLPASKAGLPGKSAMVGVGPPLFCNFPSRGSSVSVPVSPSRPLPDWIRLLLPVTVPRLLTSPPSGLLATMELFSVSVKKF